MIHNLSKYILSQQQTLQIENLIQYNEKIKAHLTQLQKKLEKIVIKKNQHLKGSQKLQKILSIMKRSNPQVIVQKQALRLQQLEIKNLSQYISKYISQQGNQPRILQKKIKNLNNLLKQAQINNYTSHQVQKMLQWNKKLVQNLQKKLSDFVSAFPTHVRIRLSDIKSCQDLLSQDICREFIKVLYKGIIVYDVPTFSYILLVTKQDSIQNGILIAQRQSIVFTGQKAQKHYPQLEFSITHAQKMALKICQSCQINPNYIQQIKKQIKNCKQNIKAQVEYILPYLSLQKRKQIIQLLVTKSQSQTTIYDILVRLKIKGQDGNMMQSNIKQLIQKIKINNQFIQQVIVFLQICASQDKGLNIGFFVCNQLLNKLEGYIQYAEIYKLLKLRQQIRFKIHHPV